MTVDIHIHLTHRRHTDGLKTVKAEGKTIGEALKDLTSRYPGMASEVFDPKGRIKGTIEIYLNDKTAYPGELERKINPGDNIQIITFLAGG